MVHDLRAVLWLAAGRTEEPSAAIFYSSTLQSTRESVPRTGYDGAKRHRGSKVHMAVDILGYLLAAHGAAARELQDIRTKRLLTAAKALAINGALKNTQLVYAAAANYYRQAAELVAQLPAGSEGHLWFFLNLWGRTAYEAGD